VLLSLSTALLLACSREPSAPEVVAPASMAIQAGDAQAAQVGTALPTPLTVVVRGADGRPAQGAKVAYAVTGGEAALSSGEVVSDPSGFATVVLTLGHAAGAIQVTATLPGLEPVTFAATATHGPAALVEKVSGDNQAALVNTGLALPLRVRVSDAWGNPVEGAQVIFTVSSGNAVLAGSSLQVTSVAGEAEVGLTAGATDSANQIVANCASVIGGATSFTVYGVSGSAVQLTVVSGGGQSATVGTTLEPFVVEAHTATNTPVVGLPITFTLASGGSFSSPSTQATGADGRVTNTLTLGTIAGLRTISVTSAGVPSKSITATGVAAAAASIGVHAGDAQQAPGGTTLLTPLTAKVVDAFGNAVSGVAVTFAVNSGNGILLDPAVQTTDAAGLASNRVKLGTAAVNLPTVSNITASATSLAGSPVSFTATCVADPSPEAGFLVCPAGDRPVILSGPAPIALKDASTWWDDSEGIDVLEPGYTSTSVTEPLSGTVTKVAVEVAITHSCLSDLYLELSSPASGARLLLTRVGGCVANTTKLTRWTQDCTPVTTGWGGLCNAPPASMLGSPATWTLRVVDYVANGLSGSIGSWRLGLCVKP
jgi:subtilisin-like proprotein convertase family protein